MGEDIQHPNVFELQMSCQEKNGGFKWGKIKVKNIKQKNVIEMF